MKGWIIYDEEGARRNAWFIQKLQKELAETGIESELKIAFKGTEIAVEEEVDFAIVRTINPLLNNRLEKKNIPVFNNAITAEIACDKWKTYLFCKENGIPVMQTKRLGEIVPFSFPFVIKSRDGHGGSEVFLIRNQKEWEEIAKGIEKERFIAQPLCDEVGKDMRLYVLGGEVLAAMLRTSKEDFRSNYSLGGKAVATTPTDGQKKVIEKLSRLLLPDFIGVDFIRHNGEWILNELEDAVGTRMLYAHTEIDAVKEYAAYIKKRLQEK